MPLHHNWCISNCHGLRIDGDIDHFVDVLPVVSPSGMNSFLLRNEAYETQCSKALPVGVMEKDSRYSPFEIKLCCVLWETR